MDSVIDQLSWEQFRIHSEKAKRPLNKVSEFNRLIAHSKNFFLISGYGAFTDGYILVISKDFIPSYGLINKDDVNEVKFLIKLIKNFIKKKYDRKTLIFEHGMCACIGGLDRAHLHLMSVSKNSNQKHIKDSVNQVLYNRKAGVKYIEYNNYKLENLHDINQIYESHKNTDKIKIVGDIMKIEDIQNLSVKDWPMITLNHITKGGHYVFFNSGENDSSFLTTHNFQTQFGREVVFEIEKLLNKKFNSEVKKLEKSYPYIEVWRWQNYMFEEKIIKTIEDARKIFSVLEKEYSDEYQKYQFKIV